MGSNWRGGTNSWYDPHGEHLLPYDANGHGTQTMGIMAGQNLSGAAIGMAPLADWIGVKIFADNGDAFTSDIHAGFQWLLDPNGDEEGYFLEAACGNPVDCDDNSSAIYPGAV